MPESFEEIAETFEFIDEWEERYRYVIELGKAFEPMDPALQIPATKVDGCASQVWIAPEVSGSGDSTRISFKGASDAMIVQGLIAILHALFNGKTAKEILEIDAQQKFATLGLDQHLSAQRSNGLKAMIARIREIAARATEIA